MRAAPNFPLVFPVIGFPPEDSMEEEASTRKEHKVAQYRHFLNPTVSKHVPSGDIVELQLIEESAFEFDEYRQPLEPCSKEDEFTSNYMLVGIGEGKQTGENAAAVKVIKQLLYVPVLRLHYISLVATSGPGHSHRWTIGGSPVVHRCPAPLFDMAIDGPPVAIDGNENLINGLCA